MKCPFCEQNQDKVIDSRPAEDGAAIRRRRECLACGARFTTYEKVEQPSLIIVKKDGTRELFDRDKLMGGIVKACMKRPVSSEQMEALVRQVEDRCRNTLEREVSSHQVGEWVMDGLKALDDVAYVRFASVYRQFKDVNQFMEELEELLSAHKGGGEEPAGKKTAEKDPAAKDEPAEKKEAEDKEDKKKN